MKLINAKTNMLLPLLIFHVSIVEKNPSNANMEIPIVLSKVTDSKLL